MAEGGGGGWPSSSPPEVRRFCAPKVPKNFPSLKVVHNTHKTVAPKALGEKSFRLLGRGGMGGGGGGGLDLRGGGVLLNNFVFHCVPGAAAHETHLSRNNPSTDDAMPEPPPQQQRPWRPSPLPSHSPSTHSSLPLERHPHTATPKPVQPRGKSCSAEAQGVFRLKS